MNNKVIIGIVVAVAVVAAILIGVGMIATQDDSSTYSVIYDGNGGTVNGQLQYARDETDFDGSVTATWNGHVFNGWFKDKGCTEKMENGTKLTSGITVYAGWTTNYQLMRGTELSIHGPEGLFNVVAKDGNVPINAGFKSCTLPDSGKTRIVATDGTDFEVIKDMLSTEYLKFTYNDVTYFVSIGLGNIKGDITVGVDKSTEMGYFEFSYYANVTMDFEQNLYGIGYHAHNGTFSDTGESGKHVPSLTVKSDAELYLVAPEGYTFNGWYTKELGGVKYEPGDEIDFTGGFVQLHAQYTAI